MKALAKLCLLGLLSSGCTHSVHQVAVGSFDDVPAAARLRPVEAEAKQSVFIGTTNTNFSDKAMLRLADTCPHGEVVGIQARHSTNHGFFVYKNRLKLTGYCVTPARANSSGRPVQAPVELRAR